MLLKSTPKRLQPMQSQQTKPTRQLAQFQISLAQGSQMICTVLVPALNVRSGPGLEYEIIAKVRGTETEVGTVLIVGRDVTSEWLAVDEVVAPGGWITGSANFVACDNAISSIGYYRDHRRQIGPCRAG
jgi:hypothetical protein